MTRKEFVNIPNVIQISIYTVSEYYSLTIFVIATCDCLNSASKNSPQFQTKNIFTIAFFLDMLYVNQNSEITIFTVAFVQINTA